MSMVLLFQHNFQEEKLVRQELTKVYGINKFLAHQICDSLGFARTLKVQELTASQKEKLVRLVQRYYVCLLYTSPSPRDQRGSRMPSSA